ncbi:MAG: DNA-binding response OmpR family regulator [Planctomycetota bacterium]|jgi:DNA-binding response OmpR family regulator
MYHTPVQPNHGAEILIIDNDHRIVELVSWFLSKKGYRVTSAKSFWEAREQLRERRPELMLSDVDLGAESALEELPRLDSEGLLPPTLVVSGYLDPQTASRLEALEPVLGTLAKPFDFAALEARIESSLRTIRSNRLQHAAQESVGREEPVLVASPAGAPAPSSAPSAAPSADAEGWVEILPTATYPGAGQ